MSIGYALRATASSNAARPARRRAVSVYAPTMRRDSRMPICVAGGRDARARESGNALRRKNASSCIACTRDSTSARVRSSGSSGSMSGHARHVHGHFVGIRRDEERDEFARNVHDAALARALPQLVQSRDGGERARRCARAACSERPHLIRMLAQVARRVRRGRRGSAEHQARRLHAPAFVALLRRDAGRSGDERVGGRVDRHARARYVALAADGREARAGDAPLVAQRASGSTRAAAARRRLRASSRRAAPCASSGSNGVIVET